MSTIYFMGAKPDHMIGQSQFAQDYFAGESEEIVDILALSRTFLYVDVVSVLREHSERLGFVLPGSQRSSVSSGKIIGMRAGISLTG